MSVSHLSDNAYNWRKVLKRPGLSLLALGLIAAIGCGEKWVEVVPTTGTVKFNGKIPVGAQIALHPVNPPTDESALNVTPMASVKNDGSFAISSYQAGDGAAPGDYVVTIEWYEIDKEGNVGPNVIPKEYANPKTSPLKVTVNAGGPTTLEPITITGTADEKSAKKPGAVARR